MSRRLRQRQAAKPFRHSTPAEPDINWTALAEERQQREQTQQQQKGSQQ